MKIDKITFNRDNLRWWDKSRRSKEYFFFFVVGLAVGMFVMFLICGMVRWTIL